jgi:hypothetical protein
VILEPEQVCCSIVNLRLGRRHRSVHMIPRSTIFSHGSVFDTYILATGASSSSDEITIARIYLTGATTGDDEVDEID